jgi:hypothetical protein
MQPGRRFIGVVTVLAVALVVVGFGVAALDPALPLGGSGSPTGTGGYGSSASAGVTLPTSTRTPAISASPSRPVATPSASAVDSPSPSPSPTKHPAGFSVIGETVTYFNTDGTSLPVAAVAGLEVRIQQGRALYYALAGNRYGLKAGSLAGEFLPFVTMGQSDGSSAQTGGSVLAGVVVTRLVNDAIARISDPADKWIVALPVDIRAVRQATVDVRFDAFGLAPLTNTPRVLIEFYGSAPLVESVPTNAGAHVLVEGLNVTAWQVIDPGRLSLPPDKIVAGHAMNQLLIYGDGTPSVDHDQLIDGRVAMGAQLMQVSGDVSVSLVVDGSHADLGPDKILQVEGVPIFVASSS